MNEEAHPEAAAILAQAGWTPHPEWGVYTRGPLVMGGFAGSFHVKDYTRIPPGHPQYGPDTPDTAEEAAAWLVARFKAPEPETNPLSLDELEFRIAPEPEAEETPQHESDGETGEASLVQEDGEAAGAAVSEDALSGGDKAGGLDADDTISRASAEEVGDASGLVEAWRSAAAADGGDALPVSSRPDASDEFAFADTEVPIDADFTEPQDLGAELLDEHEAELPALEGADVLLAEDSDYFIPREKAEPPQDRIYGLDDLDRVRAVAIHRVRLYANGLMPPWYPDDDARLATLRNFAMGVSEKRWDDDAAKQLELNALETTVRRINEIKNARDAKAEFLENATREEVGAFVVEADWP